MYLIHNSYLEYSLKIKSQGNPKGALFLESTARAHNEDELFGSIATKERYESYSGASDSMIDHFYDKLLRIGVFPISNVYFDLICRQRQKPLIDVVLEFGSKPDITEDELEELMRHYIEKEKTSSPDGPHTSCMCGSEC